MLAHATAATPWGIDAHPVEVEIDTRHGLPQMQLVGLPDASVRESKERVRSAIRNLGLEVPRLAVVINLAPADLRKEGNHLDLAIALALLVAYGHLPQEALARRLICGELGLDGSIRPVRGGLALAELARRLESQELLVPAENAAEAAALEAGRVTGAANLADTVEHLAGRAPLPPALSAALPYQVNGHAPDLQEVRGQEVAKRALEIAAAGGHNLVLVGPPGTGKTMLARRLPGILPPLTRAEAIAVTKIHSLAGQLPEHGLMALRPFRSPHTHCSTAALIGGGSVPRPGEVSLAHAGVLFLDELPEFRRDALEALRQPLEDGEVTVVRTQARFTFPARFTLVAAMNPCPCGHLGSSRRSCRCPTPLIERYRSRVSGPLLDRIDLQLEIPVPTLGELKSSPSETSREVATRVLEARERQLRRFGSHHQLPWNAAMGPETASRHCSPDAGGQSLLETAYRRLGLSARALARILKVGRTIADLAGDDRVCSHHLAEALQYRSLDRKVDG